MSHLFYRSKIKVTPNLFSHIHWQGAVVFWLECSALETESVGSNSSRGKVVYPVGFFFFFLSLFLSPLSAHSLSHNACCHVLQHIQFVTGEAKWEESQKHPGNTKHHLLSEHDISVMFGKGGREKISHVHYLAESSGFRTFLAGPSKGHPRFRPTRLGWVRTRPCRRRSKRLAPNLKLPTISEATRWRDASGRCRRSPGGSKRLKRSPDELVMLRNCPLTLS